MSNNSPPSVPPPSPNPYAGPAAPPSALTIAGPYPPTQDERTMGMLIHLLAIFTGFLGPLILWLIKRPESRFIDHNGKECLNFQISLVLYSFGLLVFSIVTVGFGLIVAIPVLIGLSVAALVFEIICCVKASNGDWPRYPLCIRFIK